MNKFLKNVLKRTPGFLDSLSKFFNILAAGTVGVTTLLVVVSSLMRYIIGKPFHFTEELGALFFMVISVFSMAYVLTIQRHIRIKLVLDHIPQPFQGYVEFFAHLIGLIIVAILIKETWNFSYVTHKMGGISPDAGIPLFPWMAVIPLSLTIFEIVLLKGTVEKIRNLLTKC